MKILPFWCALVHGAPIPMAAGVDAAPEGLPGWGSNPARMAGTAVGLSGYRRSGGSREWVLSAAGEWGSGGFRGAFLYSYYALDSLFRQSSVTLEGSYLRGMLVAGLGLGAVAEWVPGDASWLRYRVKAGVSLLADDWVLSVWWFALTDEYREKPWAGVFWKASDALSAYAVTGFESFVVGSRLSFGWGGVEAAYGFPGFTLWLGVSFGFGGYGLGVDHGAGGTLPAWNGVWISKTFKK